MEFGLLTYLKDVSRGKGGTRRCEWQCACGKKTEAFFQNVRRGLTRSCGCFAIKSRTKHGHNTSAGKGPEYTVWDSMIQRCTNPNSKAWSYYGGRGIIVHDSWLNSFSKFLSDVGQRPSNKHTIDRIDNNRSYEPGNVRWATRKEQQRNRRCNLMISHEGETLCLTDWAQRAGISPSALKGRLKIMPISEAISKPHRVIRMRPV